MRVLFIHQNFPGQYLHLGPALVNRGDEAIAIGGPSAKAWPNLPLHRYSLPDPASVPCCHPWAADLQTKAIRGEKVGEVLAQVIQNGFKPDLVIGHPAWGELLAVKDILPDTPVLHQLEFIYPLSGGDTGFDPEFSSSDWSTRTSLRIKRATQILALHDFDWGLAPTRWQASTAPATFRSRISVIHEGIDSQQIQPKAHCSIRVVRAGRKFTAGDEIVSFAARSLEPYRGFHVFMRMLPRLQELRPNAHVVIVGDTGVSYGSHPPSGGSWKSVLLQELDGSLDRSRIHFVGRVPQSVLHDLFRVSACHVYLTYPFVLSWSLLEAMACEALVIGSETEPVKEVIRNGHNGLLVDFFDTEGLAQSIASVLDNPSSYEYLRRNARQTILDEYDLHTRCLPSQLELVDRLAMSPPYTWEE